MQGVITSFLPVKNYGFIKGEDEKDYFFHFKSFVSGQDRDKIIDQAFVQFEPTATPKGYAAKKCKLIHTQDVITYVVPDKFLTTKSDSFKDWEIIEMGDWIVHGTSRDSPDAAKRDLINNADRVGANALIGIQYYKTTDSETSDSGRGIYTFSVHNYKGRIVTIAKKRFGGDYWYEDLIGLNNRALLEKEK